MARPITNPMERFWDYIEKTDTCWNWIGPKKPEGYGILFLTRYQNKRPRVYAHRFSYELYKGVLDDNLTIDHLCKNKSCVNPSHLEQVSQRVNILRSNGPSAINKRKTHCIRGHEFNDENTYRWKNKRQCRICQRARESAGKGVR